MHTNSKGVLSALYYLPCVSLKYSLPVKLFSYVEWLID